MPVLTSEQAEEVLREYQIRRKARHNNESDREVIDQILAEAGLDAPSTTAAPLKQPEPSNDR